MSCAEELRQIAITLMSQSRWFRDWDMNGLQAFIRDGGSCVYCKKPLFDKYEDTSQSCIDHLLPKSIYPNLADRVDNLVASCTVCNHIKRSYDPSDRKGNSIVIADEVRSELIKKARAEIEKRKNVDNWEGEFPTAQARFREAVAKYQDCRKTS